MHRRRRKWGDVWFEFGEIFLQFQHINRFENNRDESNDSCLRIYKIILIGTPTEKKGFTKFTYIRSAHVPTD